MGNALNPKGGPFEVKNDPGNKDLIMIKSGTDNPPYVGMEAVFPYYNMEGTINKVTSDGVNHWNIWVDGGLEARIKKKKNTFPVCYYMSRYAYVVEDGELRFYSTSPPPNGGKWPVVVARNIIQPPSSPAVTVRVGAGYSPSTVTINRGGTVQWIWDVSTRTVGAKTPYPASGPFNSGSKTTGETFTWAFKDAGTFQYTSTGSSQPVGTVTVNAWPGSSQAVKPFSQESSEHITVDLATEESRYSNRNFKAVNTLLAGSVPIRAKLSQTQ